MITYQTDLTGITPRSLTGFFVGWSQHPSPEKLLTILENSQYIILAVDDQTGQVVGFINALSDGVLSAFIPLLEVLPAYQKQGVGSELVKQMLAQLAHLYSIDLVCDPNLIPFYERFNLRPYQAMLLRNYANQEGESHE